MPGAVTCSEVLAPRLLSTVALKVNVTVLPTGKSPVLALRYDWRNNSVLCLHNFAGKPGEITLDPSPGESLELVSLLSDDHSHPEKSGKHRIVLEPYGYRWFRVGGLDYLLKRSTI